MSADWVFETHLDGVAALHARGLPEQPVRLVRNCVADRSALVLGSAQPEGDVDHARAAAMGIEVVRRRTGGGAVLVEPADIVWLDVVVPAGDPLWHDDVGRAFHWLGHVWSAALQDLGIENAVVHEGALVTTEWSKTVCFAGLGPGEVTVEGRKMVGISQRRTRAGALFQSALLLEVRPQRMAALLAPRPDRLQPPEDALAAATQGAGKLDVEAILSAFRQRIAAC